MFHIPYYRHKHNPPYIPPEDIIYTGGTSWDTESCTYTYSSGTLVLAGDQITELIAAAHQTPMPIVHGRTVNAQMDVSIYENDVDYLWMTIIASDGGYVPGGDVTVLSPVNSSVYTMSASVVLTTDLNGYLTIGIEAGYANSTVASDKQLVATNIFMTDVGTLYNDSTTEEMTIVPQDRGIVAIRYLATHSGPV